MTTPKAIVDVRRVEIDQHRWYATIRVVGVDGTVDIYACADSEHSGLWLGDPADHEEH